MSIANQDLIPIKSTTRTVQDCFRTCLYVVPDFQRPYSWDIDELEDYWGDVVLARGDFFFGSTVTWESVSRELFNNSYSIIDGQQRLTTSAIILSVIRDSFHALKETIAQASYTKAVDGAELLQDQAESQAVNTQKYLVAIDDDGNKYPVLEREEPNFREVVQNPSAIPSGKEWNGSARQIGVARGFFETKVKSALDGQSPLEAFESLKTIRNNVLKARLIQIELTSEEDGFQVFETLNTRGADLLLADLIKNLLVRRGASETSDRKTIADRWQRLVNRIQANAGSTESVDQFIWQSWNSRRAAVTEAELYKKILELVKEGPQSHLSYLEELEFDSVVYQYLEDTDPDIDRKTLANRSALKVPEVTDTLRALALFNVSVANSALLAIVRKYEKSALLQKKDLIDACRAIESFHFQFTALTSSGSTGGTRGRYNRFAVEIEEATSKAAVQESIKSLKTRIAGNLPSKTAAEEAFAQLFYAPKARLTNAQKRRSRKHFIAYVLLRIAQDSNALPANQDLAAWSIEHIRPQSQASGEIKDHEYSIGNLALLTGEANGDLGDGDFSSKRSGLKDYVPWKDDALVRLLADDAKAELSADDINARAQLLAKLAVEKVWAIV